MDGVVVDDRVRTDQALHGPGHRRQIEQLADEGADREDGVEGSAVRVAGSPASSTPMARSLRLSGTTALSARLPWETKWAISTDVSRCLRSTRVVIG